MTTAVNVAGSPKIMQLLTHATTTEAVSNGVWTSILQAYFRLPRFVIAPESNGVGGRADLKVYYVYNQPPNTSWEPVFTLEGKTPGVNFTNADAIQADNYIRGLGYSQALGGRRFGMLVAGDRFVIWVNNGGVQGQSTQWNRNDADVQQYNPPFPPLGFQVMSITNNALLVDGFLNDFSKLANFAA